MGHTHYWRITRPFTNEEWRRIRLDATAALTEAHGAVRLERGDSSSAIAFNGVDGQDCETFLLTQEPIGRAYADGYFNFCKTRGYPYDTAVTAILAIAAHHAPDAIKVSSDGGPSLWAAGLALAATATGLDIKLPRRVVDEDAET
jgi:hypothetical protein